MNPTKTNPFERVIRALRRRMRVNGRAHRY
jgi:hypothetical protein